VDAETLLTTTRSVRRKLDLDRTVEPEVLEDCLRIAQQAPAAGALLGGFRWLVVRDPALKAKIAAPVREQGRKSHETYGHLASERSLASARHLLDVLDRVPVFVIACMQGKPAGGNAMLTAFYGSAYPAIWSLQLALRAQGLGSTIVCYHLDGREREVADLLGIPEDVTQIALLPVAYTTATCFRPAERPPIRDITYYDRWGTSVQP
jgi:nitroreductase